MIEDPVLQAERRHLVLASDCLQQMRDGAERIGDYGVDALASQGLGRMRAERLAHLSADSAAPPFFGRTDRDGDLAAGAPEQQAEILHIGRRHIRNELGDPVVIDWRAPIARAFYRASPTDRQGVTLRRRFGFAGATLTSFEDEHLDRGESTGVDSDLLRAEIERPRVGPMRDIVATIQPDQDVLVRADLDTSLCIQGAPGTGKTAVGLHRAAYLLYTYPDRLRRSGVLVVGPNKAFLRYIAAVLPALGENGITQSTVDELVLQSQSRPAQVRSVDSSSAAVLKGDARMAELLRRAVFSHIRKPEGDVLVLVGTKRYRVQIERVRRYVDDARRSCTSGELRFNSGRERLQNLIAQDVRRQREDSGGAPSDSETAKVARSKPVRDFVDEVWPLISPATLLIRLFTDQTFLQQCGAAAFTAAEYELLGWPAPPRSNKLAPFSAADLVLLDELAGMLAPTQSFVHVVVDEAQDLSAMQCRAVARRCPLGSVTILGDLAQATTAWAAGSWPKTLEHLGKPDARIFPLTVGYRVPAQVLAVANRLLPHIAVDVPPATSVRGGVDALTMSDQLVPAVQRCLAAAGSIAVIVADAQVTAARAELTAAGIASDLLQEDPTDTDRDDTEPARVNVVAVSQAKGLEYDSVVLIEPAAIVAAEPNRVAGLRRLYVTWTRAVSRLCVVHEQPLPPEIAGSGDLEFLRGLDSPGQGFE